MPVLSIQATPPSLYYGITVRPGPEEFLVFDETSNTYYLDGNFDLLIKKSSYPSKQILNDVSQIYQTLFPFYESIDYLNDTEWISYLAYMKDASFTLEQEEMMEPLYIFAHINQQYRNLKEVKVVYFDNQGQTLFITDVVALKTARFYEWQSSESHLYVDMNQMTLTSHFNTHFNPFLLFFFGLVFLFSFALTLIKTVLALSFGLSLKANKKFFLGSFFSYLFFSILVIYSWAGGYTIINLRSLLVSTSFIFILFAFYLSLESIFFYLIYRKNKLVKSFVLKSVIIYDLLLIVLWLVTK